MDELLLRVEIDDTANGAAKSIEQFRTDICRRVETLLGLRTNAEIVAKGTLPRTDFKARRVIDDRKIFREMHAQIEAGPDR